MNNEMIKKLQKIEEKSLKKYLKNEEVKEMINDVIKNDCKDFREKIFFKEVAEIDDELVDIFPSYKNSKNNIRKKRIKVYSDSEDEEQDKNINKNTKK